MDIFENLWFSTIGLHRRFGLLNNLCQTRRKKFSEEATEFLEASIIHELSIEEYTDDFTLRENLAKELADVIVTAFAVAQRSGLQYRDIEEAVKAVARKNDMKDQLTHTVINGMIARKENMLEIKEKGE